MKKQKKKNLLSAFTKRQLIKTYKKPTIAVRLHYIKEAFKDFFQNIKYCEQKMKRPDKQLSQYVRVSKNIFIDSPFKNMYGYIWEERSPLVL